MASMFSGMSATIAGSPCAIASSSAKERPSRSDISTKKSAAPSRLRHVAALAEHADVSPPRLARPRRASGPSPTIRSGVDVRSAARTTASGSLRSSSEPTQMPTDVRVVEPELARADRSGVARLGRTRTPLWIDHACDALAAVADDGRQDVALGVRHADRSVGGANDRAAGSALRLAAARRSARRSEVEPVQRHDRRPRSEQRQEHGPPRLHRGRAGGRSRAGAPRRSSDAARDGRRRRACASGAR